MVFGLFHSLILRITEKQKIDFNFKTFLLQFVEDLSQKY